MVKKFKINILFLALLLAFSPYLYTSAQTYNARFVGSNSSDSASSVSDIDAGSSSEETNLPHDEILTGDNFATDQTDSSNKNDVSSNNQIYVGAEDVSDKNKDENKNNDNNVVKKSNKPVDGSINKVNINLSAEPKTKDNDVDITTPQKETEETKPKKASKRKPREIVVVGSKNKEELKDDVLYLPGFTITPPALPKNDKGETTVSNYPSDKTLPSLSINAEQVRKWSKEAKDAVREKLKEIDKINTANDLGLWIAGQALADENILNIDIAFASLKDGNDVRKDITVSNKNREANSGPSGDPPPPVIVLDDDDVKPEDRMDISDKNNGGVKDGIPEFSMEIPRSNVSPKKVDIDIQTEIRFLGIFKKKAKAKVSYSCNDIGADCEEKVEYDLPWYLRWFSIKPSLDNYLNLSKSIINNFIPVGIGGAD